MVGGLADWFAVVALFRHPLGVPIPHTAIITERKEQFGETLGEFIQSSFLTGDAVAERVRAANVGDRVARWLADPANADRLAGHVLGGAVEVVDLLEDEDVHDVARAARPRARSRRHRSCRWPDASSARSPRTAATTRWWTPPSRASTATSTSTATSCTSASATRRPGGCPGRWRTASSSGSSTAPEPCSTTWSNDRQHGLRRQLDEQILRLVDELQTSPSCARQGRAAHPRPARAPRAARVDRVGLDRRQGAAARAVRRPRVGAAAAGGRRHHRRRRAAAGRAGAGRQDRRRRRGGAPATWWSTSAVRSTSSWRPRSPAGTARRPATASSSCSVPTSSSSASTARWSAALAGLGSALDRAGARVIRAARRRTTRKLPDIERRAGELFRDVGMPEIADHDPYDADELASADALFVATGDGRRAGRLRHGRAGRRARPPRADLGAPRARRAGHRHAAARRRRRLGQGQGHAEITLTTFRDVPFNAPLYAKRGYEVVPEADWTDALRERRRPRGRAWASTPPHRVVMRRPLC